MRRLVTLAAAVLTVSGSILLAVSTIHAETIVGGFIDTDTHWRIADSPFVASSSVLVTNDATLTIDPGVVVQFAPLTGLVVTDGAINARGTESNRITFTAKSEGDTDGWNGVGFGDDSIDAIFAGDSEYVSGSIIEYAIIERVAPTGTGALRIEASAPFIHQNIIQDNMTVGLSINHATNPRISSNQIQRNHTGLNRRGGGMEIMYSDATVVGNVITENTAYGGGAVRCAMSDNTVSLTGNIIAENTSDTNASGMSFRLARNSDDLFVSNNQVVGNTSAHDYVPAVNIFIDKGNVSFSNNLISENSSSAINVYKEEGSLTFEGDRIIENAGDGIRFLSDGFDAQTVLSADPDNPTWLFGNLGSEVVNNSEFIFSSDPLAQGNLDARHVWWGTTDVAAIEERIEDFFDDSTKGIVFTDPIALRSGSFTLGDVNQDGEVNGLDVDPFVDVLLSGPYQQEADMNEDQVVNGLDVDPFVAAVVGSGTQQIPEPSTLLLCLIALGVVGGSWKRHVMRRLATLAVVGALMLPTLASGQDYTFFDWAWDQEYFPGDAMPRVVRAAESGIDSLDGISDFDWSTTPTTGLHLYDNQISSIESGAFTGLTNLTELNLHGNQISSIESGAFSGLTNLGWLLLDRNQISSIESGTFTGLTKLVSLNLYDNQISSIESGDFTGLTNLTSLLLDQNQISNIESVDFSELGHLPNLWLGRNLISNIRSGDFTSLTNLESLNLDNNQISSIESGGFTGLTKLTNLNLYGNQISSIKSSDFTGLTNLTKLNLNLNQISSIDSGSFSELGNLTELFLGGNQISSIDSDHFIGLTNLKRLDLAINQISTIESDHFSGLTNLERLALGRNPISNIDSGTFSELGNLSMLSLFGITAMTELNLNAADFSSLTQFDLKGNGNITSVSLRNAVVNQTSLAVLMNGGETWLSGIGELDGITEMDLSDIDFSDITDLSPLYVMDDLIDLWLVDTLNLDAFRLDRLLDNLATIEGTDTEGILYMTQADYDAFNAAGRDRLAIWDAEPGHHVEFLAIGDVNHDTEVNGLDVDPFVDVLLAGHFDVAADMNEDGVVNGLDVDPFVAAVVDGGTQQIPEPSTLFLVIVALGMVGGWRKWKRFTLELLLTNQRRLLEQDDTR